MDMPFIQKQKELVHLRQKTITMRRRQQQQRRKEKKKVN